MVAVKGNEPKIGDWSASGIDPLGGKPQNAARDISRGRDEIVTVALNAGSQVSLKDSSVRGTERRYSLPLPSSSVLPRLSNSKSLSRVAESSYGRAEIRPQTTSTVPTRSMSKTSSDSSIRATPKQVAWKSSADAPKRRHTISNAAMPNVSDVAVEVVGPPRRGQILGEWAAPLAFKYRLTLDEAKHICKCWSEVEVEENDVCTMKQFEMMLCAVFSIKDIPADVVNSAFEATNLNAVEPKQRINNFMGWYVQNMFTLKLDTSNAEDYALAKRYNMSTTLIDRIRRKFTQFDRNRSGRIGFEEFLNLMKSLLEVKSADQLDTVRLQKFWKEIDVDSVGSVDFDAFCTWYMKYFVAEDAHFVDANVLMKTFYNSHSPVLRRRLSIERPNNLPSIQFF